MVGLHSQRRRPMVCTDSKEHVNIPKGSISSSFWIEFLLRRRQC